MDGYVKISEYFIRNSKPLANQLVEDIIFKFPFKVDKEEIDMAKIMYEEFFEFLGEALVCNEETDPQALIEWSKGNGERAASSQERISTIFVRYPDTRMVFADYILQIGMEYELGTKEIVSIIKKVDHMLDLSINETIFAFERRNDEILKQNQNEINELSTPVVPIQDGIAVLPLIGAIDADRSQHLMNKVVPKIPRLSITCLIIDFSGIVTIDTDIAGHIFNLYDVLRLLGIQVIMTGIRSELAERVAREGIDFSSFKTYATVMQAIESLKE
ncbi:STAS domain-containing protein [Heyndrickxia acidicola]|uniref:STAS domain-containing protein n=1 Tax=Heyndrickxia acidicola TaxID=209389 RepID=A0ABU6MLG0_9BACI|nr:STAS domain-containing protein [Heyndrickxia acidicola]MED1205525.1 STAS domain-containing protein [Heyndrickxia acidicola]